VLIYLRTSNSCDGRAGLAYVNESSCQPPDGTAAVWFQQVGGAFVLGGFAAYTFFAWTWSKKMVTGDIMLV